MQKFRIYCFIFLIAYFPIHQAQAAIDVQNMAGVTLAGAGALTTFLAIGTGTAIALSGGLALGLVGVAILIDNSLSTSSTAKTSAISIQLNPKVPLIVPTGWSAPTGTNKQPIPPSGVNPQFNLTHAEGIFSTVASACTFAFNLAVSSDPGFTEQVAPVAGTNNTWLCKAKNSTAGCSSCTIANLYPACPTGYTISSNGLLCNITAANTVIKPVKGKMEIIRTGNTFSIDPQINPADILPTNIVAVSPNSVLVNDSTGSTTRTTINADGTTTISRTTSNTDGTGIQSTTHVSQPDSVTGNVTVTGTSSQNVNGIGTSTGTTALAGNSSTPSLDISSLNKESTQAQIKAKLDQIHTDLWCDNCTLPTDKTAAEKAAIDAEIAKTTSELKNNDSDYKNFKDSMGWSTWVPTFPSSSCSPMTGIVVGKTVSWNFCPYISKLNELLGWLFSLFGAWTITSMFFKRE